MLNTARGSELVVAAESLQPVLQPASELLCRSAPVGGRIKCQGAIASVGQVESHHTKSIMLCILCRS